MDATAISSNFTWQKKEESIIWKCSVKFRSQYENRVSDYMFPRASSLNLFIDSIFVEFGEHICQHIICKPMETKCAPLLVDISQYSYEAEVIQTNIKDKAMQKLKPLMSLSDILMMLCQLII